MASVDIEQFRRSTYRQVSNAQLKNLAYGAALSTFKSNKKTLLEEFDLHPITVELEAAENAKPDLLPDGNLFSFIGFDQGSQPVTELRELLQNEITLDNSPDIQETRESINYQFSVDIPTAEDVRAATPMPSWTSGSWVDRIEKGISGLQYYIFGVFRNSRSGGGIQIPHKVRPDKYRPRKYLSELLNSFRKLF